MKINELFGFDGKIDWTELRNAGAVQPMLYYPGGKDPATGKIIPPNVNQPNIITAVNLKQKLGPGEKLVPLSTRSMTDDQWQKYMDDWWAKNKNDPDAKNKIDQIKQSAREKNVVFREQEDQKINYKPTIDTDEEWKEAGYIDPATKQPRYPQLAKLGPGGFASLVNRGRNEKVTRPQNIKNTTATTVAQARAEFSKLEPDKRQRFKQALQQGEIERPIVVRFGPGDTNDVLIGGNTRFTGLMAMGIQPEVKFIDLSTQQEALEAKLESFMSAPEPKREWTAFEMACMEGGHPLPEDTINEKCWDGYKQVGMKNKGGKQVPNCVPEDAAGVGIITKQNTTKDVKPGDEYKNVKKLQLDWEDFKENFADGKKSGRKGLSKRVGIPKKATLSQLSKIAKNSTGERRRMAQWQLNMRRGRKKAK